MGDDKSKRIAQLTDAASREPGVARDVAKGLRSGFQGRTR